MATANFTLVTIVNPAFRVGDARASAGSPSWRLVPLPVILAAALAIPLIGDSACGYRPVDRNEANVADAISSARPPSIVLIFADDLGIGDVGVYGGTTIATPNVDALAAAGVRAAEGYVSHPVCSPSRAGILTGRYQARHGWEFNPAGRDLDNGMSTSERTLANALKDLGYATGMVGKWHLGHKRGHHPMSRGFDEYFGVLAGGSIHIDSRKPGTETVGRPRTERKERAAVYRSFEPVEVTGYLADVFTHEAVSFIEQHGDEPFFLGLSHTTPHSPLQATARYLEQYRHIEDARACVYAAMVASLDDSVAHVVAALREAGQYENTLIWFLSDNGCAEHIGNACSNAPHAGFKRYYHEGGVRIPFILSWPAGLPAVAVYDEPVIALDLLATFTGAAGRPASTKDCVNLLPYLKEERDGRPHDYLYWRSGPNMAMRDHRWKLIRYRRANLDTAEFDETGRLTPPAAGWTAAAQLGHVTMLYDLDNDPGETVNLANDHPDVVERLTARHAEWVATLPGSSAILPAVRSTIVEIERETVQLIY